jgi:hypothetical protein
VTQAQQERQQADAQALQQGLQAMSLQQQAPHGMQAIDPFAMRTYSGSQAIDMAAVGFSLMLMHHRTDLTFSHCGSLPGQVLADEGHKSTSSLTGCQRMVCMQGMKPVMERWPEMESEAGALGSHDFTCQVCTLTLVGPRPHPPQQP